jgi:hypothetical protein
MLNVELPGGDIATAEIWARQISVGVAIMRGTTVQAVISCGQHRRASSRMGAGAAPILVIIILRVAGEYIRHGIRPHITVDVPAK